MSEHSAGNRLQASFVPSPISIFNVAVKMDLLRWTRGAVRVEASKHHARPDARPLKLQILTTVSEIGTYCVVGQLQ